jgi:hypothetical protein
MTEEQTQNTSPDVPQVEVPASPQLTENHFWISSYPFFESTLLVVPSAAATLDAQKPLEGQRLAVQMRVYDGDGELINDAQLEFPSSDIQFFELEPLLGACKLESGMKHAHLVVTAPSGTGVYCRMHTRESAALLGEPVLVDTTQGTFFPMTFASDRSNLLCIINRGAQEAVLRCRLFVGKRSPEASWTVPAWASKVVSIESEFREYAKTDEGQQLQAYVRLSTKAGELGTQLVERTDGPQEAGFFTSVS